MSIFIGGKEYRWPGDVLNVNGGRLVEAYVNDVKVYPDIGRYVERTSIRYSNDIDPKDDLGRTHISMSCEHSNGHSLANALTSFYAGRRTFQPLAVDVIKEGERSSPSLTVDVVISADEPWLSGTVGLTDANTTAENLSVSSYIKFDAGGSKSFMAAVFRNGTDADKLTDNLTDGIIVDIGDRQPYAYAGGDLDLIFGSKPSYKYTYIGGGKRSSDIEDLSHEVAVGSSYVRVKNPFSSSGIEKSFRVKRYYPYVNYGAWIVGSGTYYYTRPWWVYNSTIDLSSSSYESLLFSRHTSKYTNLSGPRINEKPPSWACDPRVPIPSDWKA